MKRFIYTVFLSMIMLSIGCKNNSSNLSIKVQETTSRYTYNATYPLDKTRNLQKYVARALNNDLPMDQMVDATVNLAGGERFKMKATEGILNIQFDKSSNSVSSFIKVKEFTKGISKIISDK
ncbi:hypothetical protein [Pedobacter aquatilis]|uniref:hypothetical protein n=1 Tax=Pedobacter aquatilis TaxID=351343 RepID=UPI002931E745|nr:hypothetical protein [Pedobacter aquatilis]